MRLEYHVLVTSLLSIVFYLLTGSLLGSFLLLMTGIFIDLDHWIDFWLYKKSISLDVKEFFNHFYGHNFARIYLIFHSIELLPLIFLVGNIFIDRILVYGIATGFAVHMFLDCIGNGFKISNYFLTYRIYRKFNLPCVHISKG